MKSNIRELRNERKMSQSALAEIIGKTQQTVSHMERDRDRIPVESLITMSEYFGVSTDYILGLEPEESGNSDPPPVKERKPEVEIKSVKKSAGENKKILYQLILTLLLNSIDDDAQDVITTDRSHV